MFEKKIACEQSKVVNPEFANLVQIFNKAGRESLSEFEIWRTAKALNLDAPKEISKYCTADDEGLFTLKR